ncbi:phosphoenolpyruvate carboxykinase (ATP) [Flavisolibacter nicotianae]|uniref:phosphoenolpyruvate carboxykinase (ATP) n=1 Tax=Flavisolibacter nicotianae TaxID=2364882 RepID=UPI000EB4D023|nr:phosphoenolpyruvate carboxykinase (ATP) [Flavisolibacter nicotianae]
MSVPILSFPPGDLARLGLFVSDNIHYQLSPDELVQDTLRIGEGSLTDTGALAIQTGEFTGRSPLDKFTVKDDITEDSVHWNNFNIPMEEKYFRIVHQKMLAYLNGKSEIWIRDCYACADPRYRLNIRVVTEKPWTNLFAYNMFLRPTEDELEEFIPQWHVLSAPDLKLDPEECGTRQHNATIVSFKHKTILIAGTGYTGETKKSIFSILNYLLPQEKGVLSMHCSANIGEDGDTAVFFGLSGTGKTTLSTDPARKLIGDDEHGWTSDGIFNFEGGCYAKLINLSAEQEPEIYGAIRAGAIVENAQFFPGTNRINFDDASITENTRVSYPLPFISNIQEPSIGGVPKHIFFLTCDAYGVLPPISKLSKVQAMYQFISGYTAKVAGTEAGITEPRPTFSACFGAPFLPLHPAKYAEMLGQKMEAHTVSVWLVNTGWTGGPYGKGHRMKLSYTRAMISAALAGELDKAETVCDPVFGLAIPVAVPGVPDYLLQPRNTWLDKTGYDEKARYLAGLFVENFRKFADGVSSDVLAAAPKL